MQSAKSFLAKATILSLVLGMVAVATPAQAASLTDLSDTMTSQTLGTLSNHTILFTTPTGVAAGESIIVTFESDFSIPVALDADDLDLSEDTTPDGVCDTGDTEKPLGGAPSSAIWGAVRTSGTVITFTSDTGTIAAGSEVCIEIGTNAETGATGAERITNPSTAGSYTITLAGTMDDNGSIAVAINDGDQVTISATIDATLTFDLDTAVTDTDTDDPYSVNLGTITNTDTRVSGATDGVNFIWVDLDTNASGGAVVTVQNANGSSGLVSTSAPADDIDNSAGVIGDNTENYGLCVVATSATAGTLDDEGGYDGDTCAANSETNAVAALTVVPALIFDTNGAGVAGGRGQIAVGASITSVQPAHSDYSDTLTFIATGTF